MKFRTLCPEFHGKNRLCSRAGGEKPWPLSDRITALPLAALGTLGAL
jgi:hypothetical protein